MPSQVANKPRWRDLERERTGRRVKRLRQGWRGSSLQGGIDGVFTI